MFRLGVLTVSTSGYLGQRDDTSGKAIQELLGKAGYEVVRYSVVQDDRGSIEGHLTSWSDTDNLDIIVTTGGTGLGPRDVTPEACLAVIDREVPGVAEAMRQQTLKNTPLAMLSRSVVGLRGPTMIVTLPGSPKAVRECLEVIMPVLPHALEILRDEAEGHPTDR